MSKRDSTQPLIPTASTTPLAGAASPAGRTRRAPSESSSWRFPRMTTKQILYVAILQCLGAGIIDGAANFGIACAMYRTGTSSIRYWPISKGCVGGDMAVTVFIQGVLTFIISSALVHGDIRKGTITPLSRPWPPPHPHSLALYPLTGSSTQDLLHPSIGWPHRLHRLAWSAWQGLTLSALLFPLVWPVAVAATAPRWGGAEMRGTWAAPVIKLVFGAVYGALFTPVCAVVALGAADGVEAYGGRGGYSGGVREMEEAVGGGQVAEPVVAAPLPAHIV